MLRLMRQQLRQLTRSTFIHSNAASTEATSIEANHLTEVTKAIDGWDAKFKEAGVGDIDFNLKVLVAHVLKRKFNTVPDNFSNERFTQQQLADFQRFCEARCARMPLQHIIGEWDFMNITLKTAPTVFIPRPETEEFVSKVIKEYRDVEDVNMLEIGCGSGAMSLAILHELPQVRSTAIERSKAATALSWENAKMLNLHERFHVYNHTMTEEQFLPEELNDCKYDLIISNPPYVRTSEFQLLNPEVMIYENINALDGGPDGLRIARLVFEAACLHLRSGGKLWLELGTDHPLLVKTIMNLKYEGRLRYVAGYKDQYKRDRFVQIEKV